MPNAENLIGKGFESRPENINKKGRPKLVSKVLVELKEKGYEPVTSEQVKAIYEHLLNLNETELTEMVNDKTQPMLTRIVIKEMLKGKGFEVIERMIDRAQGKATQKLEVENMDEEKQKLMQLFPEVSKNDTADKKL